MGGIQYSSEEEKQKGGAAAAATVLVTAAPLSRGWCPPRGRRAPRLGRAARPPSGRTQRRPATHARLCARVSTSGAGGGAPEPELQEPTARRQEKSRPVTPCVCADQGRATKLSRHPHPATTSRHPISLLFFHDEPGNTIRDRCCQPTNTGAGPRQAERDTAARAPKRCNVGQSVARHWTSGTRGDTGSARDTCDRQCARRGSGGLGHPINGRRADAISRSAASPTDMNQPSTHARRGRPVAERRGRARTRTGRAAQHIAVGLYVILGWGHGCVVAYSVSRHSCLVHDWSCTVRLSTGPDVCRCTHHAS